jgi:adenylate cyclase
MAEKRAERRLAAIFAGDVAGYSRLMSADEEGTLARLNAHRYALVDPKIHEHRGRIFKTTGDGFLAEFASVVDAVRCALDIQRRMAEENRAVPKNKRLEFRIGIHAGDVIIEKDDIFGDGVNVAARLEGLASPGGICVSGRVFEDTEGKVDVGFVDAGEQRLKNMSRAVRAYHALLSDDYVVSAPSLGLPDRPSIAVLPFKTVGSVSDQNYVADGIVEEIVTCLSRYRWLFVIARNSSFTYKDRSIDPKQIGRELGIRYILEGSLRRAGNIVRITAQLIDASTGAHIWADHFDGTFDDIFALQDRIAESVVGAIEPSMRQAEIERARQKRTESLDAYDCYLRALPHVYANSPGETVKALQFLERALRYDEQFALAHAFAAWCREQRYAREGLNPAEAEAALKHARSALAYGSDDSTVLGLSGFVFGIVAHDLDLALSTIEEALRINPNNAMALGFSALLHAFRDDDSLAIEHAERAIRLSPLDPLMYQPRVALSFTYFSTGRYAEASAAAIEAVRVNPRFAFSAMCLAAAYVELGRVEDARSALSRALEVAPQSGLKELRKVMGFVEPARLDRFCAALSKAGMRP